MKKENTDRLCCGESTARISHHMPDPGMRGQAVPQAVAAGDRYPPPLLTSL